MSFFDDFGDDFGHGPGGSWRDKAKRGPGRRTSFAGPACPSCGHDHSHVRETRPVTAGGTRRRRVCSKCDHRWTTYEVNYNPADLSVLGKDDQSRIIRLAEVADALRRSLKL